MPFTFNAVELCVVTIHEKSWTGAKEVCKALQYNKITADIIKAFCSKELFALKYQLSKFTVAGNFVDWPKDSRKDDYYINEEGMYELVLSSQKTKVKDFRRHCCNVLFPYVRQQLSDRSHAMETEDLTSRVQALEFTNEEERQAHQQAIEEKDATISLLNDDLKNREYENVGFQGEIRTKDQQIAALQKRYVSYLSDEYKDNGISIIAENNEEEEKYPYISTCGQHGYRRHKVRVLLTRNKGSTSFADGDTLNAIVTYNFW